MQSVIVTGAGSGIGEATAKRFARDGFGVTLVGRTEEKLNKVAEAIGAPDRTLVVAGDVSVAGDVENFVRRHVEKFGGLDTLVNNAGIAVGGPIETVEYDAWRKLLSINVDGLFHTIRASLPYLEKSGGSIINVSSVSGLGGDWGMSPYNASKGAVSNLTRALALDFAPKGVRINAVAPSLTRSELTTGIMENEEAMDKFRQRIPMGRAAEPEEVADVIAFLAGQDARFVTGVILPVDGGVSASNGQPHFGGV